MAEKKSKWKKRIILFFGLPLLQVGYRLVSPFFEKTSEMNKEAVKLEEEIKQVKGDTELYSKNWQSNIAKKEDAALKNIPNVLSPRDVMSYFATQFEKEHPKMEFSTLIPQSITTSNIQADAENPTIKARLMKFQIKAKLPSSLLFPYLDHLEKYPGLFIIQEISLNSSGEGKRGDTLTMDLGLDFYLSPKEWLPTAEGHTNKEQRSLAGVSDNGTFNWFETALLEPQEAPKPELIIPKEKPKKRVEFPPPRLPVIKFVGTSIVAGEDLFEAGDLVQGWRITDINSQEKYVSVKRGEATRILRYR